MGAKHMGEWTERSLLSGSYATKTYVLSVRKSSSWKRSSLPIRKLQRNPYLTPSREGELHMREAYGWVMTPYRQKFPFTRNLTKWQNLILMAFLCFNYCYLCQEGWKLQYLGDIGVGRATDTFTSLGRRVNFKSQSTVTQRLPKVNSWTRHYIPPTNHSLYLLFLVVTMRSANDRQLSFPHTSIFPAYEQHLCCWTVRAERCYVDNKIFSQQSGIIWSSSPYNYPQVQKTFKDIRKDRKLGTEKVWTQQKIANHHRNRTQVPTCRPHTSWHWTSNDTTTT